MSTTTDYQQQATDFLQSTATTFQSEFIRFDYHFTGDKQKRNIFKITLKNDRHKYSFEFGSSLQDSLKNVNDVVYDEKIDFFYGLKYKGLKVSSLMYRDQFNIPQLKNNWLHSNPKNLLNKQKATDIYNEFIRDNTNKWVKHINIIPLGEWLNKIESSLIQKCSEIATKNFGEGIQSDKVIHPTEYDVLATITKYEVGTFDNFCSDFGYDTDSRTAYKTYKAVMKEWKNIELLFTADQLEVLQGIS